MTFLSTEEGLEKVFGNVMKHSLQGLIYLDNQN